MGLFLLLFTAGVRSVKWCIDMCKQRIPAHQNKFCFFLFFFYLKESERTSLGL